MLIVSRCLERIGDHAVDIGEQTAYLVTGEFREFTDASRPEPRRGVSVDEAADALRRTRLAGERTYLAWWRTALTAVAVGLGRGRDRAGGSSTASAGAYVGVGLGFRRARDRLGGYGLRRQLVVDRAMAAGRFAPPDRGLWRRSPSRSPAGRSRDALTIVSC